ncbi:MAG: deoxyribodipyrimidine photo-lyase [Sphingomonadaceae bacterium]|nr:deoxyribodipyrimidine photo-lyase [Sphingomonadaceae bacterium]
MTAPSIVWFRQDLRLSDQAALAAAAHEGPVVALYVLDDESPGEDRIGAAQRWWLHHSLKALAADLEVKGVPLVLRRGESAAELKSVAKATGATRVHAIRHCEPWWKAAEMRVAKSLDLVLHGGNHLAAPDAVRTQTGGRYRIFTPFWRALSDMMPPSEPMRPPARIEDAGAKGDTLADWNLLPAKPDWSKGFDVWTPGEAGAHAALDAFADHVADYGSARDLPSEGGTSHLSPHLHFGEVSPAAVWHRLAAHDRSHAFLREIGWRDFAANTIDQFPDYARRNGRPAYDKLEWRTGKASDCDFATWTRGRTGYPIVDAGMRQLWTTGWMHNRVRMIAASFLVKHLLIDWRRGERWFWDTLVDADYGNNSVNWQWIAGSGVDASLFSRIMAPLVQSAKFDASGYIREWVPERAHLGDNAIHEPGDVPGYPAPLIGHREGRERALAAYAAAR